MKILVIVGIFIALATSAVSATKLPKRGEWVCWATSIKEKECGTFGWHKKKAVALKAAMDLCENVCGTTCFQDYCEVQK